MRKKTTIALLMSFMLLISVMPVYASELNMRSPIIYDTVSFNAVNDIELQHEVLSAAVRNNINLDIAQITIYENGIIVFFEPFGDLQFSDEATEDYFYGLQRSPQSAPTTQSPNGNYWYFEGRASQATTFFTNHYVMGSSRYDLVVNNTGTGSIQARVRERSRGIFGLFTFNIHDVDIAVGGSTTATNIPAGSGNAVYVRFNPTGSRNDSTIFNGSIKGH